MPEEDKDVLGREVHEAGAQLYDKYCAVCHQSNGQGDLARFPSLASTDWVFGSKPLIIGIVLSGLQGEIDAGKKKFNGVMPPHAFLSDEQVAQLLTFLRQNFGNHGTMVTTAEVAEVRSRLSTQPKSATPLQH